MLSKTARADSSDVLTTPFMLYVWKDMLVAFYFVLLWGSYVTVGGNYISSKPVWASQKMSVWVRSISLEDTHNDHLPTVYYPTYDTLLDAPTQEILFAPLLGPWRVMCSHGNSSKTGISSIFQKYRYWKNCRVKT